MAVPLGNLGLAVGTVHLRVGSNLAGVSAEAERAALGNLVVLVGQKVDDLVCRCGVKFAGVGVRPAADMARKFDDGNLHAEAYAEIGQVVRAAVVRGRDFALDAAIAEAAGDNHARAV